MKLLLDTHLLLWAAGQPDQLSVTARTLLDDAQNTLFFSSASLWEIAIKRGLARADFQVDSLLLYHGLLNNGYQELTISGRHALATEKLPPIHKDPFDRMLIAQSKVEGITLLTSDPLVAQYPGFVQHI